MKLRCAGIAFFTEDKLREEGFFKTPDVKLEVHLCMPAMPHLYYGLYACTMCRRKSLDRQRMFSNNRKAAMSRCSL